jgi:formylglycine-generating enzyme required for sulfatase activity
MHTSSRPSTQAESSKKATLWPDEGPRILVFGSRTWTCHKTITAWLLPIREQWARLGMGTFEAPTVIQGDANGADRLAAEIALALAFKVRAFPISSDDWNRLGPRAGYVRNRQMAEEGKPHLGIGFGAVQKDPRKVDRSGSGHMLDILNELGIRVVMVARPGDYPGVYL